ncbi:MFS general substrate transporter [Pseudovirgaria hyperparasitica]|uniref:MFS general substrate transporter n=1 Tax=Pseudovirgaria hyperparasitica TaxID=470096 RepID=A0A6A6VYB7_9PEZI|nr:MFS general substrate transporter [Pseudovirgaria hyperparasitica]KAF2754704.1 MFS general substrate transporter [Pseudovirgaria hyperparasitica]
MQTINDGKQGEYGMPKTETVTSPSLTAATRDSTTNEAGLLHYQLDREATLDPILPAPAVGYRVYKRRWFGLIQLVLLNIVVSWDWLTFSPISRTASEFFDVSETGINWLSTGFLFAFVVVAPIVVYVLHFGPKPSIVSASVLTLIGSWIRYGGVRITGSVSARFGVVMFGQILIGFAQPFVLTAPTRYSDMWFTDRGRVSATALASLANPFGGAIGQLVNPFWATDASKVPDTVLYTAIISTLVALPAFFLPSRPPTPASPTSSLPQTPLRNSLSILARSKPFYIILLPFAIYVALFNALSSLLVQILAPYGLSEDEAGIAGAILIVVGLLVSALLSPLFDRLHTHLVPIKVLVPIVAASFLAFIWAPGTRGLAAPYAVCAVLGASSFALLPVSLEYVVEVAWPASPEVGSVVMWSAGQLLGGVFIVVMGALKGADGEPEGSMKRGLVFMAVVACVVVPLPLMLGVRRLGLGEGTRKGRLGVDERGGSGEEGQVEEA